MSTGNTTFFSRVKSISQSMLLFLSTQPRRFVWTINGFVPWETYCSHYSQRFCFEKKRSRSHITLMLARKQRKWFLQEVAVYSRSGLVDRAFVVRLGLNVQEGTGHFQFNQLAMVCRGVDSYLPLLSVSSHSQNVVQLILTMWWRTSRYIIVHTTENHCIICVLLLPEYSEVKPSKHESPAKASGSGHSTNHRKYAGQVK